MSRTPQEKLAYEEGYQAGLREALEIAESGPDSGLRAALRKLLDIGQGVIERARRDAGPALPRL